MRDAVSPAALRGNTASNVSSSGARRNAFAGSRSRLRGAAKTAGNKRIISLTVWKGGAAAIRSFARDEEMESVMTRTFRRWYSDRRYKATLRELRSLTARQLRELGIRPVEINRLAREAARFS